MSCPILDRVTHFGKFKNIKGGEKPLCIRVIKKISMIKTFIF